MKDEIQYDDFTKIDIRVGTILEAELVPETDKLIKCTVDFGEESPRTIVSGLAEHIAPEELVGKQCPYVINLAPRTIRGIESQGMILAIGTEEGFSLLHPNKEVMSGATVG
jgi:methionyl-tRNA synthetase